MSEILTADKHQHLRAIEALYCGHHGWLYATLKRKLGNAMDAADLAQDTFTRILASQVTVIDQPRAYLSCVAKGILVNWYQRKALERAYLEALASVPIQEVPSPEAHFVVLETLHEIDAMLDALPSLVKRTFLLSQINGLKYQDIAEQLGVSLITVKRYMKQAFVQCLMLVE
ncbi:MULTISPECIES: sigma-70 family RNA polymerase sigma factor [Pseudomonas]|jgi:RNA polymerase sigma-70 factor (ECF subfamily)|uniref:RNA polymerase sigma-70 factor, ECF subfamily n=1 Tax=Pseudomonas extremorientalis TaxID=169669 RepID=A0A1H0WG67_9PSED|nr:MULTISPECIES: sigma-70 family RNA polymerase sigma factor [Pseudomonas]KAB0511964.1 sigma-70 family RNA polymerase sigma factor [Pseudomonas extremorientalis]OIN05901.1 RNA polymerase subunit sigma [Pseudomonas extremorientalis]QZP23346.1 sigma-70 family RNA polymerase sigma factor [Pseudomonas sp. DR208]UUN90875.1 sigma-70 family RNA polymerase sigma factor [Pseudomonas extremorientalis]WLG59030.1 sigma-70 family RNA polymerase sigma factor [Pseudomonas extremorientalis]